MTDTTPFDLCGSEPPQRAPDRFQGNCVLDAS
jgi:hypothetical protein